MPDNYRNCKHWDTCYWVELAKKRDDQRVIDVNCEICKIWEPEIETT